MNQRENLLRAVRFETPDTIPMVFHVNPACWQHYPHDALQELMAGHPLLFPGFTPSKTVWPDFSPVQRKDQPYLNPWGCLWCGSENGITGIVTDHPLVSWDPFAMYRPPNPDTTDGLVAVDWDDVAQAARTDKAAGNLVQEALPPQDCGATPT
jgi:uroporphyrinogen decarboxylase